MSNPETLLDKTNKAEKYIIKKGIISFLKQMHSDFDRLPRKFLTPKIQDMAQLYVIYYQIKASLKLIKKHNLDMGNYLYEIEDLKDQVLKLKKSYKPIFLKDYANDPETWYYDLNLFYK